MSRKRVLVVLVAVVAVAAVLAVALGGAETSLTVSNEGEDLYVVEVYRVSGDATVTVEHVDGSTQAVPADEVGSLANVSAIRVPQNESRDALVVFQGGSATANATVTGSRFVYAVHDGDPGDRTYLGVGEVDCGDRTPSANLTIRDGRVRLDPNPCE